MMENLKIGNGHVTEEPKVDSNKDSDVKMKKVDVDRDYEIDLMVRVERADGIDNMEKTETSRLYKVVFWVHPEEEYHTQLVTGRPDPIWKYKCRMQLDKFKDFRFLHVEVIRYGSWSDPGTSDGVVVVGRAKIPMPISFGGNRIGGFGLTRPDVSGVKGEGHIDLSMTLQKFEY